ncbi:MAG: hypothetical protein QXT05_02760 [Candidatus Bilamarchaeaceae archaeon]
MQQPVGARAYILGSIGIGVLGVIFALIGGSLGYLTVIGGLLAGLGALGGVLFWKYGYILIPLLTQRTRTIMITSEGYEVPPEQDCIVKNANGVFYASAFLGLKIYESATEKALEENVSYDQYFERAISNLKYVTKISYMLYVEDVGEKRKAIETKRAEAQLRLQREREKPEPDALKIDKYEREVAHWDAQLNKLIKGVKPMGIIAYAMTTASGLSKEAAIAAVRAQASELKTVLANALNVEVVNLTADEMLKCFEWERFYPVSPHELEESVV